MSIDGEDPTSEVSFSLKESETSFSQTPRRRSSGGQTLYALKAIQLSRMSDEFVEELKNEVRLWELWVDFFSIDYQRFILPLFN